MVDGMLNEEKKEEKGEKEGKEETTPEEVLKRFEENKDLEFQSFIWGRNRWFRVLYHPLLWLTSTPYRFYRFSLLPKEKRAKKASSWAKTFMKSIEFPDTGLDEIVSREKEISMLQKSVSYHVFRNPETIRAFKVPPPKVFVVKGGTGTGKTYIVRAIQRWAFEEGIKEGIVVRPQVLKASEIFSMFYGASAVKLASTLEAMFSTPSVILIDEAQQFVLQSSTAGREGEASTENVRVESELIQKIDLLEKKPIRSILMFATDKYENLLPTVRRRAVPIDMDLGIDESSLLEISRRMCEKYKVNLDPSKILHTIGQTLRAIGQSSVSFGDIVRTFQNVIRDLEDRRILASSPVEPTLEDFARAAKSVRAYSEQESTRAAKEAIQVIRPPERYSDVGGLSGTKEDIITEVTYALNPDLAKQVGLKPPGGFLLHGPPGTGKTLLAKAIAGENNATFLLVKGPQVFSGLIGESERTIRDIFAMAKKQSPSIIFIDEIDAVAPRRGSRVGDAGVSETVLTALLNELEGFNPLGQVVFIGATNRKELLDPAILERLSHQYEFSYPKTVKEKKEIIEVHLKKAREFASHDVTIDNAAKIFLKRVFSPRVVAQTVDKAISFRGKDILACYEMTNALKKDDFEKVMEIKKLYKERLQTIHELYLKASEGEKPEVNLAELYEKVAGAIKDSNIHPLTLYHIEKAFERKIKDENLEELRLSQRIYRGKSPEIGKTYGLSTDEKGENALILAIEAEVFPASGRRSEKENPVVLGTVQKSIKENAYLAKEFLRKYCPNINDFDIDIHLVSPMEGTDIDDFKPTGYSAGMAISLAMASAVGKFPIDSDICMTGRIELKSGIAGLVGGIHPKRGSGKIDVAADEGFKKVIIPMVGYEQLAKDFKDYIDAIRERGTEIVGARDVFEYAEIASGLKAEEIKATIARVKVYPPIKETKPKA